MAQTGDKNLLNTQCSCSNIMCNEKFYKFSQIALNSLYMLVLNTFWC